MQKFVVTIAFQKPNGDLAVLVGANATLYVAGTSTLATLYDDHGSEIGNPAASDSNGLVQFSLDVGSYDISYGNGGAVVFIPNAFTVVSSSSYDPTNVAITGGTINGVTIGGSSPPNATLNNVTVNGNFKN